jgi:hypothetical protein
MANYPKVKYSHSMLRVYRVHLEMQMMVFPILVVKRRQQI